ncbi:MAG: putative toxin-antitoxin system toxin component, PIN family [Nitrospirae bacterium]|nr:putative toxin-antitoxin system toxin component, PIN family [Nitrospirota bacterium]
MRVILDTNVYISAMLFGGKCEEILKLANQSLFEVVISKKILYEIKSVLKEKFHWTDKQIAEVIKYIKSITTIVNPDISLAIIKEDPADNKIIECAVASNATYIVTGDKHHLLSIKEYSGIKILSPIEFLRL